MSEQDIAAALNDIESAANAPSGTTEENTDVQTPEADTGETTQTDQVTDQTTESETLDVYNEEYKPDYTYKVYDEVKEFDDAIKPLINKDNEELFRDLYSKAGGIDGIKTKLEKTREDFADVSTKYGNITNGIRSLQDMIDKGQYDDFFQAINIDDDKVYQYALSRARRDEMSPEERQRYDQSAETRRRARELELQNQTLTNQWQETVQRQHDLEMQQTLSQAKINTAVDDFDSKYGAGSFEEQVRKEGVMHFERTGKDMTISDAVNKVVTKFGYDKPTTAAPARTTTASNQTPVKTTTITKTDNTIPNTGSGGNVSPVKKKITSLDQLDAIAQEAIKAHRGIS